MIRIAIFGNSIFSESIIRLTREYNNCLLTGIYSGSMAALNKVENGLPVPLYLNPDSLIEIADAVVFTDQVYLNFESIKKALKKSRHVFLFPDAKLSFFQTEELNKLAEEAGVMLYMKHKHLNPALKHLLQGHYRNPEYIHIYRKLNRTNAHAGKSIFDSLYHEIIFSLSINRHGHRKFQTSTVPYCSPDPSLINVRIDFVNGTTASITLNNFTREEERHTEIYAGDKMIVLDTNVPEICIVQKNPHETNSYSVNLSLEQEDNANDEYIQFLQRIDQGQLQSEPFESGILHHLTATQIIHEIIPYPVEKTGSYR